MNIFSEFWASLTGPKRPKYVTRDGRDLVVYVRCNNCKEKIEVRLRTTSEVQRNHDKKESEFFVRKIVTGKKCFQKLDLQMEFDRNYGIVKSQVNGDYSIPKSSEKHGGKLITRQEYLEDEN